MLAIEPRLTSIYCALTELAEAARELAAVH
jgi:hypothetical protein